MKVHLRRSVWRQHPPSSPVREMAATVWQQNLSRRKKNLSAVAQRRRQRRRRQRQRRRWHSDESSIPSNRVSCRWTFAPASKLYQLLQLEREHGTRHWSTTLPGNCATAPGHSSKEYPTLRLIKPLRQLLNVVEFHQRLFIWCTSTGT